jgi:hypothetical protein
MSKRIPKNSFCPLCNSGLKYKNCCGKNEGIRCTNMRFISTKTNPSQFEKDVYDKLGSYPDDFINPIRFIGEIIYILIDESNIDDYYAVSGIIVLKSEIEKNQNIKCKLNDLVDKYNIDNIHFTDIFGRKKVLGAKKKAFLKEYVELVKGLDLKSFSVCMSEAELKNYLKVKSVTKEQCYIALVWKMMFDILIYLISQYGHNLIIEMWRENENITDEKRILHQININDLIKSFPFANISIYRHYLIFMKEEILFSSLSDFVAYLTIGLNPKMKAKFSAKELVNNFYDLLIIYNEIFDDTFGMKNIELEQLLTIVREREKIRSTI